MKFEYQTVTVKCEIATPEGQKKLSVALNERGTEGWELVHIVSQTRYCHIVLKKAVPPPPEAEVPPPKPAVPSGLPTGGFAGTKGTDFFPK